jgi:hypothetical protein
MGGFIAWALLSFQNYVKEKLSNEKVCSSARTVRHVDRREAVVLYAGLLHVTQEK